MLIPEAKKLLAETIRGTPQHSDKGLRAKLLGAVHSEADRRYRLSLTLAKAGLDEAHQRRRERIEEWVDVRARATKPKNKTELKAAQAHVLQQAEKEAAATLLNRLILLRHLEAVGLSKPAVLTGGWNSRGYQEFRAFAPGLTGDETEGYATLLRMLFDELAVDLPGLFGDVGLTSLFAIPAATLREIVERLDVPGLASAWTDDTTLGWVYQYWNDPDREALDAKISDGGKIEPHEIASKTQMFTERYMVEWLLQNSLGLTWLAMCNKHGWVADAERVLPTLEARRVAWRTRREAGEVALDALMPIEGELEEQWKYYVPQPIPDDAVEKAPESVRALKILDPACGSGHFLVIAFGMLASLYREEARHRGEVTTDRAIAESILENNLHGIDIDPRAIQIAAAGLYLKAKLFAKDARPKAVNLVAPILKLGNLPADDPAVVRLREELKRDVGIPVALTNRLLTSLAGVDYLGSLFKVDKALNDAIVSDARVLLGNGEAAAQGRRESERVKLALIDKLEEFVGRRSKSGDLGLRLDGEQVAAGVRFVRMAREGTYDVVVGNPPYQGISKTESFDYVTEHYPRGKADLFAAFLERGLEFARLGGTSALLTMRGWMFLGQFTELRKHLLKSHDLRSVGDFDRGAFDEVPNEVLAVCVPVLRRGSYSGVLSVAAQPTPFDDRSYDRQRTNRKRAAVLAQVGRYDFDPRGFAVIEGEPIVYWWSAQRLARYFSSSKLGALAVVRQGLATGNDGRYLRRPWEVARYHHRAFARSQCAESELTWAPYIKGGDGAEWFEPVEKLIRWVGCGLEKRVASEAFGSKAGNGLPSRHLYFRLGVAFSMIGTRFQARAHRMPSIIGHKGSSVFVDKLSLAEIVCLLNSGEARYILQSLCPGLGFQVGDVTRLPVVVPPNAEAVYSFLTQAFDTHEVARETSIEFKAPGSSPWRYAQDWAQGAVDRPQGSPLPPYEPTYDQPAFEQLVSFYAPDLVKACCLGLLRGKKLLIRPGQGGEITSYQDPGVRELFTKDHDFRRAEFFPAVEGEITAHHRVAIRRFFKLCLQVDLEPEDEAFTDATFLHFLPCRDRLRDLEQRIADLPGRPSPPQSLQKLGRALEDCCRSHHVQRTVVEVKRNLEVLREGLQQLAICSSELTPQAIETVKQAARVRDHELSQLRQCEELSGLEADAELLTGNLALDRPWREAAVFGPAIERVRARYVEVRRGQLNKQNTEAETARIAVKTRQGFAELDADAAHRVLRHITESLVDTTQEAISPTLVGLRDGFAIRIPHAQEAANDQLDLELINLPGPRPVQVVKLEAHLRNREIADRAQLQALLKELEDRITPLLDQGARVRLT